MKSVRNLMFATIALLTINGLTKESSRPLIWAHRGARSLAPENTLAAGRMAAEVGADGWEFDVRMTKDGELILIHDDTLTRTTNVQTVFPNRYPWKVNDFTLAEIRQLDAGSWFLEKDPFGTIAAGDVDVEKLKTYRGEPVPTLEEALRLSKGHGLFVNIEIKAAVSNHFLSHQDQLMVDKVLQLIHELGLASKVLISSFNPWIIRYLKEKHSEIRGAILMEIPMSAPLAWLKHFQADGVNPRYDLYDPQKGCELRREGFEIHVWTVNEIEDLVRLINDPCVSGIITDWPQRLCGLLRKN